jgi:hypothetical protein
VGRPGHADVSRTARLSIERSQRAASRVCGGLFILLGVNVAISER